MKLSVKKALIIFCFCLVMGGFLWFQHALSASILQERDAIEGLAKQEVSLKGAIAQKYALLEVYRDALSEMEESRVEFPADNVAFFAAIEKVMAGNKLKINKVNPVKSTTPTGPPYWCLVKAITSICFRPSPICGAINRPCAYFPCQLKGKKKGR